MEQHLQEAAGWLKERLHQSVFIQKEEQGDLDQTKLQLEHVLFSGPDERNTDDYLNSSAIILQGNGTVLSGEDTSPLPWDAYFVPTKGLVQIERSDKTLKLQTERAQYTFIIQ